MWRDYRRLIYSVQEARSILFVVKWKQMTSYCDMIFKILDYGSLNLNVL